MGQVRPFIEPCNGKLPCYQGAAARHGREWQKNVTKYPNITTIINPSNVEDLLNVQLPINRPAASDPCGTFCTGVGNQYINDSRWLCGVWPEIFSSADGVTNVRVPPNDFQASSEKKSYFDCFQYGFNNVQAARNFHGALPFNVRADGTDCATGLVKSSLKYRTVTFSITLAQAFTASIESHDLLGGISTTSFVYSGTAQATRATTVNAHSGERTTTATDTNTLNMHDGSGDHPGVHSIDGNFLPSNLLSAWDAACDQITLGTLIKSTSDMDAALTAIPTPTVYQTSSINGGHWPADGYDADGNPYSPPTYTGGATLTATNVHCTQTTSFPDRTIVNLDGSFVIYKWTGSNVWTFDATLSDPYHFDHQSDVSGLVDDANSLLAEWMLDNTNHFPTWRKDGSQTVAPFVTRKEVQDEVNPRNFLTPLDDYAHPTAGSGVPGDYYTAWSQIYYDPHCYVWIYPYGKDNQTSVGVLHKVIDGRVIGAPLPLGYGEPDGTYLRRGCYDYFHDNYESVSCSGTPVYGLTGHGNWTPDDLPAHCPQWTPDLMAGGAWPCAFGSGNLKTVTSGAVKLYSYVAQKMAIAIVRPPAGRYNFARPFGADRTLKDWTTADHCDTGVPVKADGSALDLRYPTCPGFGGRLRITASDLGGGNSRLTFAAFSGNTIAIGDNILIATKGMTAIGSAAAVTAFTSTSVDVAVAFSTLTDAFYIVPALLADGVTSGLDYYWDDADYKGSYVRREWTLDNTNAVLTHSTAQECYEFQPCYPIVVCYSPNGEVFDGGVTYASVDGGIDGTWLGQFETWMADPLFKQGKYCDVFDALQDDVECYTGCAGGGSCENLVPQVEALSEQPTTGGLAQNETAPALPADATYDFTATMSPPSIGAGAMPPWQKYHLCYA